MNYEALFEEALAGLRAEGRYRIFAELERKAGQFPHATRHAEGRTADVTVWCSNHLTTGSSSCASNQVP